MKELQKYYSILIIVLVLVSCKNEPKFHTIQGEAQGSDR